jgi:tetratricopeptide (TPR) repeat protein
MLDKDGNRIDRRNPQDIFTPLYNNQIPPGAGQTVHYELTMPEELTAPVTVEVKLQYRKFDTRYMDFVARTNEKHGRIIREHKAGQPYFNNLPIVTLAEDRITFPVAGIEAKVENPTPDFPLWQRWNDYGIGLLLKGKAELRQAEAAFQEVEKLKRFDGPLNLARVYNTEGRLSEAVEALTRADAFRDDPDFPRWTWAWLSGAVNRQEGRLEEAANNLRSVLEDRTPAMIEKGFDFSLDFEVINLLGQTLFDLGRQRQRQGLTDEARDFWRQAVAQFEKTLTLDSEDVTAHYNLALLYQELGDEAKAEEHRELHLKYKPDDNAQGRAVRLAREQYPAANHAAEAVVKYPLQRDGAPGLKVAAESQPAAEVTSAE